MRAKNVYAVKLRRAKNNKVSAAIVVMGQVPKLLKHGKIFSVVDVEVNLPNEITYHGGRYKAKMVLKIFCKIPDHVVERTRRLKKLKELSAINPILFPHAHTKNIREAWSRPKGVKDVFYPKNPFKKARIAQCADSKPDSGRDGGLLPEP